MNRTARPIAFLLALLPYCIPAWDQNGIFIPEGGKVFVGADTASFFASFELRGQLSIAQHAVLQFLGSQWTNAPQARITDEYLRPNDAGGNGGEIRFVSRQFAQQLSGGYNPITRKGPVFSRIDVANPGGLSLVHTTTKLARQLTLTEGLLYLNQQTLVVGHLQPGIISGYNDRRFLVAGMAPGSGMLLREGLSSQEGPVVFPLGTSPRQYTPLAVRLQTNQPDEFAASVFGQVRSGLYSGFLLADQTVNTTWELSKLQRPGTDSVQVTLQHPLQLGGPDFRLNGDRAFVSLFGNSSWDTIAPTAAGPGVLATGAPLAGAATHTRQFTHGTGATAYFTKMALPDTGRRKTFDFYGYRMDAARVHLGWGVQPEINVHSYLVQRWFANNRGFTTVDTVPTQALNGSASRHLYYQTTDPNDYTGISFYRLLIRYLNGQEGYSETIAVSGVHNTPVMHLWPNPTPGPTHVSISTALPVHQVVVWNLWGQKLHEELADGRRIIRIDLRNYARGVYLVGLISPAGKLLAAEKVVKTSMF